MATHDAKPHRNILFRLCCTAAVTLACFLRPTTIMLTQHLNDNLSK